MQGTATPWYRVASSDLSSLRGDEPTEPTLIVSERPHPSHLVSLVLASVVDSAVIHRINLYPLDGVIGSPIHWIGMRYPAFEQLGPGALPSPSSAEARLDSNKTSKQASILIGSLSRDFLARLILSRNGKSYFMEKNKKGNKDFRTLYVPAS